jgi:hypothetical protein
MEVNMKRKIVLLMLLILLMCSIAFAGFRVGDGWKPITFSSGMFHGGGGANWIVNQVPPTFIYKDLGDTVMLTIRMQPEYVTPAAAQLVIELPNDMPLPIDHMVTGLCTLYMGPNWDRLVAQYEMYAGGWIVIWPLTGMFPENKFPQGNIGVSLQLFYRY